MITVTIDPKGDAFGETPANEIHRILRGFADKIGDMPRVNLENESFPLHDLNGNKCGCVALDDLGNAAFEEEAAGPELASIFKQLANKVAASQSQSGADHTLNQDFRLRDTNGNTVGKLEFKELSQGICR